ncbi:E3 ubiquitin-protein ligase SPL1 isoform X2 [Brassica rapa]|uniref:RING-type E3 ubiquitin transferase n=1 Tax=Brassica campestris TaxID=3711 RepID=M4FH46_BRACM|nr:E3 ubiquitin-protein ligase SPL1 isoform X2 [Brassica rapa]XP_048634214.1 E3 ubiquitin-protein ligase SPL1 isoform X2 [Brassica napus]
MEPWSGLCCIGAVALYLLSRRTARDVDFLKSVTRVDQLKDLESAVLPSIVAVSGTVGSETPIKCEHSGILSVILQETAEQQFLKRNWKFSWVQDTALMLPVCKEVPWFLDDGTGRVIVEGARSGIGFELTVGGEVFEKPEASSLVRGTLDFLRGLEMLGIRRIERVLPVGTRLTVVGQTIKDGVGDVRIQKPDQGPFYVSPIPLDHLISKVGKWSRRFKKASMGLAVVGVILISKPVIKYILVRTGDFLERRQQRLLKKRVVDAAAKRKKLAAPKREERVTSKGLENGKSRDGDEHDRCVVCLERKCDAAFVPCGHMCCCLTCALKLLGKPCPLCRKRGIRILKIYRN